MSVFVLCCQYGTIRSQAKCKFSMYIVRLFNSHGKPFKLCTKNLNLTTIRFGFRIIQFTLQEMAFRLCTIVKHRQESQEGRQLKFAPWFWTFIMFFCIFFYVFLSHIWRDSPWLFKEVENWQPYKMYKSFSVDFFCENHILSFSRSYFSENFTCWNLIGLAELAHFIESTRSFLH